MSDEKTKTLDATTLGALTEAPTGNLPATVEATPQTSEGGLTFASAYPEEQAEMEKIIAGINLTDPDTVTSIGGAERQELARLADQLLDSFKPDLKLAFAEAFSALIDGLKANSLDSVKKRSAMPALKKLFRTIVCLVTGKDYRVEIGKSQIKNFMKDVTGSRQTIEEVSDKLVEQKGELAKNWNRINELGRAINQAAQRMRIVRAATAEYIRRVNDGEITQLADLEAKANETKRADDIQTAQLAQASWGNLQVVDGDLLGSISVYEMNVANLAFTRQANIQNRMKTDNALTSSVAEWKSQLALFAIVLTERTAQQMISNVEELTKKSVEANSTLFDELVDAHIEGAAKGMHNLKAIAAKQEAMTAKLEQIGPAIEEQFNELARDKEALEVAAAKFRENAAKVFSTTKGVGRAPSGPAPKF